MNNKPQTQTGQRVETTRGQEIDNSKNRGNPTEFCITVPRSKWIRGTDNGYDFEGFLAAQNDAGEYCMCIMGFVGQAFGLSPADMKGLTDLADVETIGEDQWHEREGAALYRRGILTIGENDRFESPPEVVQIVLLNDDADLSDEDRETELQDRLLNHFGIHVRFTE